MKSIIFFFSLILLISCKQDIKPTFHYVTLLVDITDIDDSIQSSALGSYGQVEDNDGICLSLALITDVHNNPKQTICLDSFSDGMMANTVERNHDIREYNEERTNLYDSIDSVSYKYEESHVLRSICRELEALSNQPQGGKKRLVVFSNLFENTSLFSVFDYQNKRALSDPEQLATFFEEEYNIPDSLDGISLEIRYEPTRYTETLHDQIIDLYRHLFEPRGGSIITHHEQIIRI